METLVPLLAIILVASAVIAAIGLIIWAVSPDITTYDVSHLDGGEPKTLGGIPFYVKKARHVHATSYLEWLMELSIEAEVVWGEGDAARREPLFSGTKIVPWPNPKVTSLQAKLDGVARSSEPIRDFQAAAREFRALEGPDPQSVDGSRLTLESNSIEQIVQVDYSDPHYINSRRPRSGSSESSVEIGADGSLSKATAKAEDKTLAALTDMLPISKLVEKQLTPSAAGGQAKAPTRGLGSQGAPGEGARVEVSLEQKSIVIRHTLSKILDRPDVFSKSPIAWPEDICGYAGGYRRELVVPPEPEKKTEDEPGSGSSSGRRGAAAGEMPAPRPPTRSVADRAAALADQATAPGSPQSIPGLRTAARAAAAPPTARYNPDGGDLTLVLQSGHAHTGRYTLLLWDGSDLVHRSDDLSFEQAQPLGQGTDGRAIDCIASVTRLGDPGRYHLTAIVVQDGTQIGTAEAAGEFDGATANERITLFMEEA